MESDLQGAASSRPNPVRSMPPGVVAAMVVVGLAWGPVGSADVAARGAVADDLAVVNLVLRSAPDNGGSIVTSPGTGERFS